MPLILYLCTREPLVGFSTDMLAKRLFNAGFTQPNRPEHFGVWPAATNSNSGIFRTHRGIVYRGGRTNKFDYAPLLCDQYACTHRMQIACRTCPRREADERELNNVHVCCTKPIWKLLNRWWAMMILWKRNRVWGNCVQFTSILLRVNASPHACRQ